MGAYWVADTMICPSVGASSRWATPGGSSKSADHLPMKHGVGQIQIQAPRSVKEVRAGGRERREGKRRGEEGRKERRIRAPVKLRCARREESGQHERWRREILPRERVL